MRSSLGVCGVCSRVSVLSSAFRGLFFEHSDFLAFVPLGAPVKRAVRVLDMDLRCFVGRISGIS